LFPVFDVQYDIDENGLRIEEHLQTETKEHLILGGCSMVFGVALKAEDTLSSVMRSENSSVNTVNFGFPGGGIQNLIRAMDFINIKNYAKEENGTFVYMFLPNHMHRWQPTSQFVSWASPKHVYYEVKDHKLYPKELSDSEAYKNFQIAKMAGLEHSYLKANGIKVFNDSDYGSFAEGIKELRRKYLSLYPKGKFLVSIYPDYIEVAAVDALKAVLLKEKIEFLDFISDFEKYKADKKMNQSQFYVPVDGHHNRAFNEFVATKLGETIFKK
jgi:hypothetical protein